jgi:hypothetical protein
MSQETINIDLLISTANSAKSIADIESSVESLKNAISNEAIGGENFKKLSSALRAANDQTKLLDKQLEGLEPQQKAESFLKMGEAVVGGFTAAQGAMALMGTESEAIEQTLVKVNSAIAIANGVRMVSEGALQAGVAARLIQDKAATVFSGIQTTATYALTAAQTAYNLVVGTGTTLMKAFRLALASTGIGALVVGLGLLVTNFDTVIKYGNKFISVLGEFAQYIPIVYVFTKAWDLFGDKVEGIVAKFKQFLEYLNIIDTAEENASQARLERTDEQLKGLDDVKKKRQDMIDVMTAEGRSEEELYNAKKKLLTDEINLRASAIRQRIALGEEVSKEEKKQYEDSVQQLRLLDAAHKKSLEDKATKEKEAADKKAEEDKKKADDEAKRINDLNKATDKLLEDTFESRKQKELDNYAKAEQAKIDLIKANSVEEIQLKKDLQQKLNDELIDKQLELDKENNKKAFDAQIQNYKDGLKEKGIEITAADEEYIAAIEGAKAQKESEYIQNANQEKADKKKETDETATQDSIDAINRDYDAKQEALGIQLENEHLSAEERKQLKLEAEQLEYEQSKSNKDLTNAEMQNIEAKHQESINQINADARKEYVDSGIKSLQALQQATQAQMGAIDSMEKAGTISKEKAAKMRKDLAKKEMLVNTALSIANVAVAYGEALKLGYPAAIPAWIGVAAQSITVFSNLQKAKALLGDSGGEEQKKQGDQTGPGGGSGATDPDAKPGLANGNNAPNIIIPKASDFKTIVVETDITSTQKRVSSIQESAKI